MLGLTLVLTKTHNRLVAEKYAAESNFSFATDVLRQREADAKRDKGKLAEYESSITVLIDRLEKAHHDRIDALNSVEKLRAINENTSRDLNELRSVAARQHGVLEAVLPIVEECLCGEPDEEEDPYADAVAALEELLSVLENNAPINAREGNKAQAAYERKAAKSVSAALSSLKRGVKHG